MVGLVLLSVYQFRRIKFQQQLRFAWLSIAELIKNGGWLLIVIAVYASRTEMSSDIAFCALFASVLLGLIVMPREANTETKWPGNPMERITFSFIFGSKEVFLYALFAAVFPFLPILMANHERNEELLATYGAAIRYQAVLGILVYSLNTVCLPMLASSSNRLELLALIRRFYRAIPLAIVVGAVAIAAVILIIPLIDGGKYPKLPLVFFILSGCSLLSLIAVPLINFLLIEREYKKILTCMVLGIVANVISYALMQGSLDGYEIAAASLLGYGIVNIMVIWLGWEKFRRESKRLTV